MNNLRPLWLNQLVMCAFLLCMGLDAGGYLLLHQYVAAALIVGLGALSFCSLLFFNLLSRFMCGYWVVALSYGIVTDIYRLCVPHRVVVWRVAAITLFGQGALLGAALLWLLWPRRPRRKRARSKWSVATRL